MFLFQKTKNNIFKCLCFLFVLSLFAYCQSSYRSQDNYDDDDERDERRRTTSSRRGGSSSLRSVDGSSSSTRSFTPLRERDFEGPDCEESRECRDFCADIFPRSTRSQCENLPEDMVELLHASYKNLENMRSASGDSDNTRRSAQRVDPAALAAILDIDVGAVLDLPKSKWSIREVKEFLNWLAQSPLAVKALEDEDSKNKVFKETLRAFSKRENAVNRITAALSLDVGQYFQTFFYQAQNADNERAFQYTFDFLNDNCGGVSVKNCKLLILCAREEEEDGRYRSRQTCPYLSGNRRRQREDYCYAQGPNVWSYINGLIDDNDLHDADLESITELNEEFCENFCKTNNCERTEF